MHPPSIHSASTSSLDMEIRRRLSRLQDDFNPALQEGGEALTAFYKSYSRFLEDASDDLPQDTYQMVYSFVEVVNTISSAILEIDTASEAIHVELEREIEKLARVDFKNLSIHDAGPLPPYIEPCYVWLLGHLHNPYPSKNLRVQMSKETGTPLKDLDAWFIDVRKRIGWNDIRRAHFETRFDMVKAATRHFNPSTRKGRPDSVQPNDYNDGSDYSHQFVTLESRARELYAHKFFPSTILTNLDRAVHQTPARDLSAYPSPSRTPSLAPETPANPGSQSDSRRKRRHSEVESESGRERESVRPQRPLKRSRVVASPAAYPTPSSNFPSSPGSPFRESVTLSPSVPPSILEEPPAPAAQAGKRKRRVSESHEYDSDSSVSRAMPRRRVAIDEPAKSMSPQPQPQTQPQPLSLKRKRRLSDAQDERPRKLPHHVTLNVPRLQTVSNPLPLPSSFFSDREDSPVSLSTDILPSSTTFEFGDMHNLEVESFDYGSLPILNEYLAESEKSSKLPDHEEPYSLAIVGPAVQPFGLQDSGDNLYPLFDFNLPTSTELSLPSPDNLFSDIDIAAQAIAPEAWATNQLPTSFTPTFDPTFAHTANILPTHPSGVNPLDLLLHPSSNTQSAHGDNSTAFSNTFSLSWDPAFGAPSQTAIALQKIQSLEAQLEMCKTQLAQQAMYSF